VIGFGDGGSSGLDSALVAAGFGAAGEPDAGGGGPGAADGAAGAPLDAAGGARAPSSSGALHALEERATQTIDTEPSTEIRIERLRFAVFAR
jgi:hypothetical protein